jgi:hypothetical protein
MTVGIVQVQAGSIDFSDDFDDSDHSGWTILQGLFVVDDLHGMRWSLIGTGGHNIISHSSSRTSGTWLFEMYEDTTNESIVEVIFISQGSTIEDFEGYSLCVNFFPAYNALCLYRWNYSSMFDRSAKTALEEYYVDDEYAGWFSYNVTRTENGDIYVARDDELVITAMYDDYETFWFDSPINTSVNLVFRCEEGGALDNVVVGEDLVIETDTITPTSSETPTKSTTTNGSSFFPEDIQIALITGISLMVLVVVLAAIRIRRKKSSW